MADGFGGLGGTHARMELLMASRAEGDSLTAVILVHGDGVFEDGIFGAIKPPEAKEDVVEVYDVMNL
jgi:hypothetical protein